MQDFFRLIRWKNLLFTAIVIWALQRMILVPMLMQYGFEESLLSNSVLALLIFATLLLTAGGYVINDYFDIKIDAINRPDSQIVGASIPRNKAMLIYQILTSLGVVAGIVLAILLRSWTIGLLFVFVPGLLWFYSSTYKRMLIVGNIIVAIAVALIPIVIAFANVAVLTNQFDENLLSQTPLISAIYKPMLAVSLFAFMLTLIREIIKDMQDQYGDRELECHTLPIVVGNKWTKIIVVCLMLITLFLLALAYSSWIPYEIGWGSANANYAICFAILWIIELVFFLRSKRSADYGIASSIMKILMAWGCVYALVYYIQACQQIDTIISLL